MYFIDVSGLTLIVNEADDASVRDFLLLLDGEKFVDSSVDVAKTELGEGFPEHVQWIGCALVLGEAEVIEGVPVLVFDMREDGAFPDFGFL